MSSEGEASKKQGGWGGWAAVGELKQLGASWQNLGKQVEEKLHSNQTPGQQEQLNASNHEMSGSKHGLGGNFISRLQYGLNSATANQSLQSMEKDNGVDPSKISAGIDPFPGPDTPFQTPAKQGDSSTALSTSETPTNTSTPYTETPTNKLSTPMGTTNKSTSSLSSRSLDDVSKEELLETLKKTTARVKLLSQSRAQLIEKVKHVESDKARLVELFKNEIVGELEYLEATEKFKKQISQNKKNQNEVIDYADIVTDEVIILQSAWRSVDEKNQLNLQHIQNEYKVMAMQAQAEQNKVRSIVTEEKDKEIQRMKEDMKQALNDLHADRGFLPSKEGNGDHSEIEKSTNSSYSEQLSHLEASHKEEVARLKADMETMTLKTQLDIEHLRAAHAEQLEKLKLELESSSVKELKRVEESSKKEHDLEMSRIVCDLKSNHALEFEKFKADMMTIANSSQSERLDQLVACHKEELARVRSDAEASALKEFEESKRLLLEAHKIELEKIKSELEHKHTNDINQISCALSHDHGAALQHLKSSHNEQLQQLTASHQQELDRVQTELETIAIRSRAAFENEISTLNVQISSLREENENMQSCVSSVKSSLEQLQESINEKEDKICKLNHSLKSTKAEHETELRALKAENDEKQSSLQCYYDEKLKSLEDELKKMHTLEMEQAKNDMMITSMSHESDQLQHILVSHKDEISRIRSEMEASSTRAITAIEAELSTARTENSSLAAAIENLQKELTSKESIEIKLKELNTKNHNEVCSLESRLQTIHSEHSMEIEKFKAQHDENLSVVLRSNEDKLKLMEKVNNDLKELNERLVQDLEGKNNELSELKNELNAAEKKSAQALQVASKIKNAASEKLKSITEDHANAIAKYEQTSAEVQATLQSELECLQVSLNNNRKEVEELKAALERTKSDHINVVKSLEDSKSSSSMELENKMTILMENHESSISLLKSDHEKEMAKVQEIHKSVIENLQADNKSKIETLTHENSASRVKLQQMMAKHADELKDHYEKKFNAIKVDNSEVLSQLRSETEELRKEIRSLDEELNNEYSEKKTLQKTLSDLTANEEKLLDKIEKMKNELIDSSSAASASANQMLEEQDKLQLNIKELRHENGNLSIKNEELSGKLQALSNNLGVLVEEKRDLEEKLEQSLKLVNKYKNAESELNLLRQENNALKLEQTKMQSILAKLKQECDDNEKKHGQRTALVGMLEEQIVDLNDSLAETKAKLEATLYDMHQKDEDIESTKQELEKVENSLKIAESKAAEIAAAAQQNIDDDIRQKSQTIISLKGQIENLQSQMKKKSLAAQKILKEREVECLELRKANKLLQIEVDKGSLSDRRIFELAAQQSNRETAAVVEIDIRDKLVAHLTEKLEQYDGDLASAELIVEKAESQVENLARVHRREGVNMDYLKSIVVQYLAKPPGSSERAALLPVLATLLQFDASDYKAIEEGKQKVSWWGEIIPTYITGPEEIGPSLPVHQPKQMMSTSAEVTISRTPLQTSTKKTSLQF